ncbi:segregation/condensation protein A [Streptomyces sp. adm13(2018)]|uniref:segregation and condensation protein A n=1 Tax=Streptomyces sp. adm13(2018) TaxID=2479007 RepID=UPI0011CE5BA5|nr:segregation/condensation protein A [Streptomyces sp. adm13(2018)]TXS14417.1 segregation/condensation protein A [Streptomyces sp. adm13(2018)]
MHHAPDETSRPPRRRALGRGPGDPPAAPPAEGEAEVPVRAPAPPEAGPATGPESAAEPALAAEPGRTPAAGPEPAHGGGPGAVPEREATSALEATADPGAAPAAGPDRAAAPETAPVPPAGPEPVAEPEPEPAPPGAPGAAPVDSADGRFTVRLANFEGPFDLLLQLITKHKLDVTEVALSRVTDEFMAHLRALGPDGDLDQTTEFLVVAATLLDLKAARLLPAAEVEDEADLALLEARDLLFARLLQYRAYKRIAAIFEERWEAEGRRHPRTVGLEPHHAQLLPEVVISIGAEGFARLAVKAMQPKAEPQVYIDHIHAPLVSVREQAAVVVSLLRERGTALFRELIEDVGDDTLTVVARFLALLELYREKAVGLDQETALGDLTVTWTGGEADPAGAVTDEFDQETAA